MSIDQARVPNALTAPRGLEVETHAVAQAIGLSKVYGGGAAEVVALNDVTVQFGRGQLTAIMDRPAPESRRYAPHGRTGHSHLGPGRHRRSRHQRSERQGADATSPRPPRVCVSGLPPRADLTARENITLPVDIAGSKLDKGWFDTVVDTLGIRDRLSHRPNELSGISSSGLPVRALVSRPAIVFADEPTGNLDSRAIREILKFPRGSVDDFGETIVMVTHDPVAASYARPRVVLAGVAGSSTRSLLPPRRRCRSR